VEGSGLPAGVELVQRSTAAELGSTPALAHAAREVRLSAASTRTLERRMTALRQANEVRSARAKLKQELRQGKVRLEEILASQPDYLSSAEVVDLLVSVPKIGPVRAARLLNTARVSESKTVGGLSDRQRASLIELLHHLRFGPST
jgi:S13-like H2TH domain